MMNETEAVRQAKNARVEFLRGATVEAVEYIKLWSNGDWLPVFILTLTDGTAVRLGVWADEDTQAPGELTGYRFIDHGPGAVPRGTTIPLDIY